MVDIRQATLASRTVRFRLCVNEASPIPSDDPRARTGVADLQERRALLHEWSFGHRPRNILERYWSRTSPKLGDILWQDERLYLHQLSDEDRAWLFFGSGEVLTPWPLWPLDLLAAVPDAADGQSGLPGHRSARVDLTAARLMSQLLLPGPIRLSAIADVPIEAWLNDNGLISRVSATLDGGTTWTIIELHDHGAALSVPRIDPARAFDAKAERRRNRPGIRRRARPR